MPDSSIETLCIFHEKGMCFLHEGAPTKCELCFNFASVHRPTAKGKIKSVYGLQDYLDATGHGSVLYPTDESVQETLNF